MNHVRRLPDASGRNAHIVGEPQNRKAQPGFALEAAVAKQMRIDRAVEDRELEPRRENVFQFFAHFYNIDFFVFHGFVHSISRDWPTGEGSKSDQGNANGGGVSYRAAVRRWRPLR